VEDLIQWIVMVLIFQGVAAFIQRKSKKTSQGNSKQSQTPNSSSTQEKAKKAPLEDFFGAISKMGEELKSELERSKTQNPSNHSSKGARESAKHLVKDYYHIEKKELSEDTWDEDWVTDEPPEIIETSNRPKYRYKTQAELEDTHSRISPQKKILQKTPFQQAVIWKEILGKPKGLEQ